MKAKILWRIAVATSPEAEDAVSDLLGGLLGQTASSYFDLERQTSLVCVYHHQAVAPTPSLRQKIRSGLARINACGLNVGPGNIKIGRVRPEDWAESWKRHFKPIEIGRTLLIKPGWSRRRPKKGQAVVILDPGLSFGTGQHPTTAFCLGEVARLADKAATARAKKGATRSFLDIGTGSGILAITAAKLNYHPVIAFDFDPESVRVARANAEINEVLQNIHFTQKDAARLQFHPVRKFDLVCANLISNLLVAERKRIIAQLNQGGTLVLAGILKAEFRAVQSSFAELGWRLFRTEMRNEWQSGSFRKEKKD